MACADDSIPMQSEDESITIIAKCFEVDIKHFKSCIKNIYPNKEIFLRELISNSSDALNKIRWKYDHEELCIKIILDKNARTLTVIDNGIGMTRDEMMANLGTIARSANKTYEENRDGNIIGQFGMGFYSVYIVADEVIVTSKRAGAKDQYQWESSTDNHLIFIIKQDRSESLGRGTKVVLRINSSHSEYLEECNVKKVVQKYCEKIKYPIKLLVKKECEKKSKKLITKTKQGPTEMICKRYEELEVLNTTKPSERKMYIKYIVPTRCPRKIPAEFFFVGHLSIPTYTPIHSDAQARPRKKNEIKFYVGNVYIMNCEKIIPPCLNFVEGEIFSEKCPLNIYRNCVLSKEIIYAIHFTIVETCLEMLANMASDPQTYKMFYAEYGKNVKMGIYNESTIRNKLVGFLRYYTSASGNEMCSLEDYISRMKENQEYIYFITGESIKQMEDSVFIEALKMRDIEVIYMTDPIDEFIMDKMKFFAGKPLMSVSRWDLVLPEEKAEREERMQKAAKFKELCKVLQNVLVDEVEKVVISNRLVKSACCIVNSQNDWTTSMERVAKTQVLSNIPARHIKVRKVLEINPDHDIIKTVLTSVISNREHFNIKNIVHLLFDTALLSSGLPLETPNLHVDKVYAMFTYIQKYSLEETTSAEENEEDEIITEKMDKTHV